MTKVFQRASTHGLGYDRAADWRERAACSDQEPELFFPIGKTGVLPAVQVELAKAVCRRCDVADQCLRWALESGEDYGVWGGMTEEERRELKQRSTVERICEECGDIYRPTLSTHRRCAYCRNRARVES